MPHQAEIEALPVNWALPSSQLTPAAKRGTLLKKAGNFFGFWHRRHIVLSRASLAIYDDDSEPQPKRVVQIDTVDVISPGLGTGFPARFKVLGADSRVYYFACRTQADMLEWVKLARAEVERLREQIKDTTYTSLDVQMQVGARGQRFYIFLLDGRLALAPVPEFRDDALHALADAQLPGAVHTVFLPPTVAIEDKGEPCRELDVNFGKNKGPGVRLDFNGFGDRPKLIEWRNKFKEMCATNLTSKAIEDPLFAAAVHEVVWEDFFLPQANAWSADKSALCPMETPLWALFYSKDSEAKARRALLNTLSGFLNAAVGVPPADFTTALMKVRAGTFVAFLEAYTSTPLLRALVLAFPMTEGSSKSTLVADFVSKGRSLELRTGSAAPKPTAPVVTDMSSGFRKLIADLRKRLVPGGDWDIIVKKIFLEIVKHPAARGAAVSAEEELAWFVDTAYDRRKFMPVLTYECLATLVEPMPDFCIRLFVTIAVTEEDRDESMRKMLDNIDRSIVIKSLREDRQSGAAAMPNPIITGLVNQDWAKPAKYLVLLGIVRDFDLLNDAFWATFLRTAFAAGAAGRVVQFLDTELFSNQGYYYNVATAGLFQNCASKLVEELDLAISSKTVAANDSNVALLIEMALRFEHLALGVAPAEMRLFVTLGRWKADAPETRSNLLYHLLTHPHFVESFAHLCGASAGIMDLLPTYVPSAGSASAPAGLAAPRSSTVLPALVGSTMERRRQHLLDSLYGFMATAVAVDRASQSTLLANFLGRQEMGSFFATYFSAEEQGALSPTGVRGQMRGRFVEMLTHDQKLKPAFKASALSGETFFTQAAHFRPDALALLNLSPAYMAPTPFLRLIEGAMKLGQYSSVAVKSLEALAMRAEVGEQLTALLEAVKARKRDDFFPGGGATCSISLGDLGECAAFMVASKNLLLLSPAAGARLQLMFSHILATSAPETWREQMRGSSTVAFFIKYLDREDLAKAYAAFGAMERNKAQPDVLALLEEVRAAYPSPVVAASDLALEAGSQGLAALMAGIEKDGAAKPNAPLPLGLLWRVTAKWMQMNVVKVTVPMAPRNVQSVAFLLCAAWARRRAKGLDPGNRTLIAQVGTGEGKSLLIAMLALFSVLELKKEVIILENNKQLLSRDRADFVNFFKHFGIETAEQRFEPTAKVSYCLREDIEAEYRKRVLSSAGGEPFANTVLVVDEVDALVIDGDTHSNYIAKDYDTSTALSMAYAAVRDGKPQPKDVPDRLWTKAQQAKVEAAKLFANLGKAHGVRLVGKFYKVLDERCEETHMSPAGLYYLNFEKLGTEPSDNTVFYIQSLQRVMASFPTIFGLSGSLGGDSEREYMAEAYGAKFVQVPGFLNTCTGPPHQPPTLLKDAVIVHDSGEQQLEAIVALAVEKRRSVPVLVIMHDPELAARVQALVSSALPNGDGRKADKSGAPHVQLYVSEIEKTKLADIVMKATEPIEDELPKRFRVTVTDYSGGRGIDYNMPPDSEPDDAGGLLVILSCIPKEGEREWIQWRGRTARKDRRGQYAVILNRLDEPLCSQNNLVEKHVLSAQPKGSYSPELIKALLAHYDSKNREKLMSEAPQRLAAMRRNELCDKFYGKFSGHGLPNARKWPFDAAETKLRDFLRVHICEDDPAVLAAFAVDVGIVPSAAEYRSRY